MHYRSFLILSLLLGTACATPSFQVNVEYVGSYDPTKNDEADELASKLPWDYKYAVDVLMSKAPEGMTFKDRNLEVMPGYEDRYSVLATITSQHRHSAMTSYAMSTWWYIDMHDKHSSGRDVFCKIQTPLRTLSLGIWSLFSPTSWPCQVIYPTDKKENMRIHVQELKRAAAAVGANLVFITSVNDEMQVGGNQYSVQSYKVGAAEVRGFAIVDRKRPKVVTPPPRK